MAFTKNNSVKHLNDSITSNIDRMNTAAFK